jgi:K+ transporter
VPSSRPDLNPVEERVFLLLAASNLSAAAYFRLPPDQVVELGIRGEV